MTFMRMRSLILRKDMKKHKDEECENCLYTCQYCQLRGTYISINGEGKRSHYNICDQYPLDCPNNCGARKIKRKVMSLHRDNCILEPLNCPFQYASCPTHPILRKDMDSHCKNNMQSHLLLMAKSQQELARKNETLSKTIDKLVSKNQELALKVDKQTKKTEPVDTQQEEGYHDHDYYDDHYYDDYNYD